MDDSMHGSGSAADRHAADIDRSVKELQQMIKEHEAALAKLKNTPSRPSVPGGVAGATKASLDVMTAAYDEVLKSEPFLPSVESLLPALLAMRRTANVIAESREYTKAQNSSLLDAKKRLDDEKARLADQKQLQVALEARLESLRSGQENGSDLTPAQIAKEKLDELRKEKRKYDTDTSKLIGGLKNFFNDYLGAMLAAEELGGPVVGDLMDIDTDDLAVGFNAQGKPKKSKKEPGQDKRQMRINEIWGNVEVPSRGKTKELDEAAAAGAEMQSLIEELLNQVSQSGGDSSAAYVTIPQENAAARFLVRSKVAQFHPRDATQIRLVDFGRELDD